MKKVETILYNLKSLFSSSSNHEISPSKNIKVQTECHRKLSGIYNGSLTSFDSNRCFMNTGFQLIMSSPRLLTVLIDGFQKKIHNFENQKLINTPEYIGYKAFLEAVDTYQRGGTVNLTPLRALLYDGKSRFSMGDSEGFIDALTNLLIWMIILIYSQNGQQRPI